MCGPVLSGPHSPSAFPPPPPTPSCPQVVGLRNVGMAGTRHNAGEAAVHWMVRRVVGPDAAPAPSAQAASRLPGPVLLILAVVSWWWRWWCRWWLAVVQLARAGAGVAGPRSSGAARARAHGDTLVRLPVVEALAALAPLPQQRESPRPPRAPRNPAAAAAAAATTAGTSPTTCTTTNSNSSSSTSSNSSSSGGSNAGAIASANASARAAGRDGPGPGPVSSAPGDVAVSARAGDAALGDVVFLLPDTFMNVSGSAVARAVQTLQPRAICVVHDGAASARPPHPQWPPPCTQHPALSPSAWGCPMWIDTPRAMRHVCACCRAVAMVCRATAHACACFRLELSRAFFSSTAVGFVWATRAGARRLGAQGGQGVDEAHWKCQWAQRRAVGDGFPAGGHIHAAARGH
jgi:hypothetical protein